MIPLAVALLLPACGGYGEVQSAPAPIEARPGKLRVCNADAAQAFLGQMASAETGAAILKASGAQALRWGPPNSAWTMDYRPDRVNVRYDEAMAITGISCG
ncbi:MAG: I78 family peptidase inhibitor [Erythrobacter sp.]